MHPGRPPSLPIRRVHLFPTLCLAALLAASSGCSGDLDSRLAEIRSLQQAGDFEASIEPLRGLVTTNSGHPEVNFRLGLALARTGRQSLSIWPLQKAVDSEEHGLAAGLLLISALLYTNDFEEAVRAADRILAVDPENTMALYGRGQANISGSKPEAKDTRALILRSAALSDLDRLEEAESVQLELEQVASDAGDLTQAARACASRGVLYARTERPEEASTTFRECVERYPTNAVVRNQATDHFVDQSQFAEAIAMWRAAVEEQPEDGAMRVRLAELLRQDGRSDEAEAVLTEMVELFDSAGAWRAMAGFRRSSGEIGKAREALDQAIERTRGNTAALRFEVADLLIEEGDIERARQIAGELKEPAYSQLLYGAIALKQDDPKAALEAFESGLRRWPNNAGARYLAGIAAERLDDMPRAMAEYREAVRNDPTRTNAALRLAQIHYEQAEYAAAYEFVMTHIHQRPFRDPAAHILAARAATRLGNPDNAAEALRDLMRRPGQEITALVELADAARQALGAEAAIEAVERSGADSPEAFASSEVQRAIVGLMSEAGRPDEAISRARAETAENPDDALAHDLLGRVLLRQGQVAAAKASFERAISLDATIAGPHEGLGFISLAATDPAGARDHFETAARLDPSSGEYVYRAAQTLLVEGNRDAAIARLGQAIEIEPAHVGACNDLAWLLAETGGDLELALELARRAVRAASGPATRDTLGWVHLKRGDADLAEQAFARAIAAGEDSPSLQYHLGLALARQGKTSDAVAALRKAVEADSFPEVEAARTELARLEQS